MLEHLSCTSYSTNLPKSSVCKIQHNATSTDLMYLQISILYVDSTTRNNISSSTGPVANLGFPRGGGTPTYFPPKLCEIWTQEGRASLGPPWIHQWVHP